MFFHARPARRFREPERRYRVESADDTLHTSCRSSYFRSRRRPRGKILSFAMGQDRKSKGASKDNRDPFFPPLSAWTISVASLWSRGCRQWRWSRRKLIRGRAREAVWKLFDVVAGKLLPCLSRVKILLLSFFASWSFVNFFNQVGSTRFACLSRHSFLLLLFFRSPGKNRIFRLFLFVFLFVVKFKIEYIVYKKKS